MTSRPPAPLSRSRWLPQLLILATLVAGCAADEPLGVALPAATGVATVNSIAPSAVALSIVLPPADAIEPSELARVRLLVERALGEVGPLAGTVEVLEPRDSAAQLGIVEVAARRSTNVCVLGAAAPQILEGVRQLYPALSACLLTAVANENGVAASTASDASLLVRADEQLLRAEVDLWSLGMELGRSARAAAGEGLVVVLAGDPMLDRNWIASIMAGARPGPVSSVRDASAVLGLLELLPALPVAPAGGGVPAAGPNRFGELEQFELADEVLELRGLRIGAVVLDASVGVADLAALLLEQGVPVIGPRSVLADSGEHPALVARWRVRWDVPLAALLRALANGGQAPSSPAGNATSTDPVGIIEPGPAFRAAGVDR